MVTVWYCTVTGCGSGPTCDSLTYYIYMHEVTCEEWISDQQGWIPDNCQVVYAPYLHLAAIITQQVKI